MAKITLGKVSNTNFTNVMQELVKQKLPVSAAFKLKTLTNKFNDELKKFNELRVQILDTHCKRNEDGSVVADQNGNYQFEQDALAKVAKEMGDLMAIEIEFEPIRLQALGDISMSAEDLFTLGEVIDA